MTNSLRVRRYFNILYNAEAHDSNYHSKSVGEPTHGTGLFIYPLSFDAKANQTTCLRVKNPDYML
jgi:hypothetical protein